MVVPGVVVVGLVEVGLLDPGVVDAPGVHGFATVADVPLGVELLLVPLGVELLLVLDPAVVVLEAVPLVVHGPATVPVPLVPIPVEVLPTWPEVVDVVPEGVDVVPDGVEVVPEGVLVWGDCDPVVGLDPVMPGLVVLTEPALPVVPAVPVAEGVVCVADGLPLVVAPPGAVVVELVPVWVPDVPAVAVALPVVCAVATPMASVSANALKILVFIISLNPGQKAVRFEFL